MPCLSHFNVELLLRTIEGEEQADNVVISDNTLSISNNDLGMPFTCAWLNLCGCAFPTLNTCTYRNKKTTLRLQKICFVAESFNSRCACSAFHTHRRACIKVVQLQDQTAQNTYPTCKIIHKLCTSNNIEVRDIDTLVLGVHGVALHFADHNVSLRVYLYTKVFCKQLCY